MEKFEYEEFACTCEECCFEAKKYIKKLNKYAEELEKKLEYYSNQNSATELYDWFS